jgi:hypothetical protein
VTKDSVTIKVNAVMYYKVTHPEKAIISVYNYQNASYQAALTVLRNIIGQHQLDEVLRDRDRINQSIKEMVAAATICVMKSVYSYSKTWQQHSETVKPPLTNPRLFPGLTYQSPSQ